MRTERARGELEQGREAWRKREEAFTAATDLAYLAATGLADPRGVETPVLAVSHRGRRGAPIRDATGEETGIQGAHGSSRSNDSQNWEGICLNETGRRAISPPLSLSLLRD